jgi:hypothetical protein
MAISPDVEGVYPRKAENMAYQRHPLSVLYDHHTNLILDRLYRAVSLPAVVEAFVLSPPDDPRDVRDSSLTVHERAFIRSLYYQLRLRHPRRSIRRPEWFEKTPKGHRVIITMYSDSSGVNYVEQHPESSWAEHPELRSSGLLPDEVSKVLAVGSPACT